MPCYTIVTNTVDLGKVGRDHPDLLEAAIRARFGEVTRRGDKIGTVHGSRPQVSEFIFSADGVRVLLKGGSVTSTLSAATLQGIIAQINKAVSREAIKLAAKRFGWTIVPGLDADTFSVQKQ